MRIRYPSSFIKLLLIGFAFAVLPLLWAFANAYLAFDTLALQSQHTIQKPRDRCIYAAPDPCY